MVTEHARERMVDFGIPDDVFWTLVHDAERKHIGFGAKVERLRKLGRIRNQPDVDQYIVIVVRFAEIVTVYTTPIEGKSRPLNWTSVSPGYLTRIHRSRRHK